jgi:hypothetical protein
MVFLQSGKKKRGGLNKRTSSLNEMVVYCYNNNYLYMKPMLRTPNCLVQKIYTRPLIVLM